MTQQQINAAHRRSLKTTYKHLSEPECKLVKMQEKIDELDKSISTTYRLGKIRFGENFRKHPGFLDDFDFIWTWEETIEKLMGKISRIEDKHTLNRKSVMKKHRQYNQGQFYGGSF